MGVPVLPQPPGHSPANPLGHSLPVIFLPTYQPIFHAFFQGQVSRECSGQFSTLLGSSSELGVAAGLGTVVPKKF